jgi:lysine 2,3-aminomutase
MKQGKLISSSSSINEETDTEPPGRLCPDTKKTRKYLSAYPGQISTPISPHSRAFLEKNFPSASDAEWNDWQWQLGNSFTDFNQLSGFLQLSDNEVKPFAGTRQLPLRITPYFAGLLSANNPEQALRKTMVPVLDEFIISPVEKADPLGEKNHSPVANIVHRYPDRALFLVTGFCAAYCRYCTRSHLVSKKEKCHPGRREWDKALDYIRAHNEIRDVLISGGDPLTLSDWRLEYLLSNLRDISHVEIIRIGTKVPVVLPQRITRGLARMLRRYHPLFISIHFTHPDEVTPETEFACNRLADAGIPLGSQTVLLQGINDDVEIFKKLTHQLLKIRVRPYYLYQCDPIPGSAHFRTPVSKGLEIIRGLRGFTSGYAIPHFVIDAPGGGGKIPLLPDYVVEKGKEGYLLVNYENKTFFYPEGPLPGSGVESEDGS